MKDRERGVKCREVKYRKKHKIRELESQTDRQRGMEIQNARTERERGRERGRERRLFKPFIVQFVRLSYLMTRGKNF